MIAPATTSVDVVTESATETRGLARALAAAAKRGDRIELVGPLGAGKTEFAKGFAEGLGIAEVVNSPSFTLMSEYRGRLHLFHIDLYRLQGARDAFAAGTFDERQRDGVTLVEWADRLRPEREPEGLQVNVSIEGDVRNFALTAPNDYTRYLEAAAPFAR